MSVVYKYLAGIVLLAVLVQIGFAGYGAFSVAKEVGENDETGVVNQDKFDDVFGIHAGFGYLVILLGLLLLIVALVARHRIKHSAILFGLLVVQLLLAWFGYEVPWIGFFHPINAILIAGLTGFLATSEWRGGPHQPAAAR
jgi:hypothetical protein